MQRRLVPILASLLFMLGYAVCPAQDDSAPELVVTLNEGIYLYLQGEVEEDYETAIERFASVLETDASNRAALLFRALAQGRIGLLARGEKQQHRWFVSLYDDVLEIREDPQRRSQFEQVVDEAEQTLADDAATATQKSMAAATRNQYRALLNRYTEWQERSDEELKNARQRTMAQYYAAARRERGRYLAMIADLKRLTRVLDHPSAVIPLLEVVANAKVARADEEEARGLVRGEIAPEEAGGDVEPLRAAAAERLDEAAKILEALLGEELDKETSTRAKFFLGVIRYRQALPMRAEDEPLGPRGPRHRRLEQAERLMAGLADDETTDPGWRCYAAFYLGIILPFRAADETSAPFRNAILEDADRRLTQAATLNAENALGTNIPDLVRRQRDANARLGEAGEAPIKRNDITLSLSTGARYDTNVVLLGERTDLPLDISREDDFGFTAGGAADYTWDVTERLTFGFQGRTSQLWNVDVDEFDQEAYGGSVALQVELLPDAEELGPVYLALQYDFDYTLLGRATFLKSHSLTPSLRMYWDERRAQTDVALAYQVRDYFEPLYDRRFDRDGAYVSFGVSHRLKTAEMTALYRAWGFEPWGSPGDDSLDQEDFDYPQRFLTPYVGARYAWDATAGDEFDRRAALLSLGIELPLPRGWRLDASGSWEWEDYPQDSLVDFHRRGRRDFVQEYGLVLSRTYVLREGERRNRYTPAFDRLLMTVRAHALWTIDDSNVVDRVGQAIFEYDRAIYGLSVNFTFN